MPIREDADNAQNRYTDYLSGTAHAPSAASDGYAFVRSSRELAASSPYRPSLLPARTSDRIREHEARLRAVGLECGVGLGPGGVEAANDERKRIDRGSGRSSAGLVRAEPKVEVGHSEAMAGRAEFADDIAALDFLAAFGRWSRPYGNRASSPQGCHRRGAR